MNRDAPPPLRPPRHTRTSSGILVRKLLPRLISRSGDELRTLIRTSLAVNIRAEIEHSYTSLCHTHTRPPPSNCRSDHQCTHGRKRPYFVSLLLYSDRNSRLRSAAVLAESHSRRVEPPNSASLSRATSPCVSVIGTGPAQASVTKSMGCNTRVSGHPGGCRQGRTVAPVSRPCAHRTDPLRSRQPSECPRFVAAHHTRKHYKNS